MLTLPFKSVFRRASRIGRAFAQECFTATVAYLQRGGNFTWEMAVPNGFYEVHFVREDALAESHFFQTTVENWLIGDSQAYDWDDNWIAVLEVKDGRLSMASPVGSNNKICFVEIQGIDAPPTLAISAEDAFASEGVLPDGTTNTAKVTITRVGSTNAPLWVSYGMSGSASNGVDFFQVYQGATNAPGSGSRGSFYLPAGQSAVEIIIVPLENDLVQSNRTVTFTLEWSIHYSLASGASTTTVTVADNDFVTTGFPPAVGGRLRPDRKPDSGKPPGDARGGNPRSWKAPGTGRP